MLIKLITLFIVGLIIGSVFEFFYRSFRAKKVITPRFVNIQIYAIVGIFVYLTTYININIFWKIILFFVAATTIEYINGLIRFKVTGKKPWDYSKHKLNFQGLICLDFSIAWTIISVLAYLYILPLVDNIRF